MLCVWFYLNSSLWRDRAQNGLFLVSAYLACSIMWFCKRGTKACDQVTGRQAYGGCYVVGRNAALLLRKASHQVCVVLAGVFPPRGLGSMRWRRSLPREGPDQGQGQSNKAQAECRVQDRSFVLHGDEPELPNCLLTQCEIWWFLFHTFSRLTSSLSCVSEEFFPWSFWKWQKPKLENTDFWFKVQLPITQYCLQWV